ncbi:MAG: indolepyruvate oxidoreductase subunit beta [Oscillospiraceae bacterium]
MSEVKSVLFVGVGGQGTILAGKILTAGLISGGYDVKMSEVHGMAQRGGSVTTQVRFGEKVLSPLIGEGAADVLVAFEKMEALRVINGLKKDGIVIVNDYEMPSMPILTGAFDYPKGIMEEITSHAKTFSMDADGIARSVENPRGMNVVLLGALIKALGLCEQINWEAAIAQAVKPQFVESNIKALHAGMAAVK